MTQQRAILFRRNQVFSKDGWKTVLAFTLLLRPSRVLETVLRLLVISVSLVSSSLTDEVACNIQDGNIIRQYLAEYLVILCRDVW